MPVAERAHFQPENGNRPDQHAVLEHRHGEQGSRSREFGGGDAERFPFGIGLICLDVGDVDRLPRNGEATKARSRTRSNRPVIEIFGECRRYADLRHGGVVAIPVAKQDPDPGRADVYGIRQHGLEHRFEFPGRAADDLKNLRSRRLLFQRLREIAGARLHLVEQPHILDRDHRLVGKRLHQFDLPLRVFAGVIACQREYADGAAFPRQRNDQ